MLEKVLETAEFLKKNGFDSPEVGIVLGTGLGKIVNDLEIICSLDYTEIPHFPLSTVEFHKGKLIMASLHGKKIIAMQGRFHFYEGYSLEEITFPIRVMKFLGIQFLLISNAGGAMNLDYKKGELMLFEDHINLLPGSPLTGPKEYKEFGSRFTDLSAPYSKELNHRILDIAKKLGINIRYGVYVAVAGPQLETRAEYRFLRGIGADVVGMSTVPEVIVANQMGVPVCAISALTDECNPDDLKPVDISDILASAAIAEKDLIKLFNELIKEL